MAFGRPKVYKFLPLVKINIGIDQCFTTQEAKNIIEALIRWQDGIDGLVVFHIGNMSMKKLIKNKDDIHTNYSINIIKTYSVDKVIQKYEKELGTLNGLSVWHKEVNLVFVVVDRVKTQEEFVGLVMHEVGHMLGLEHRPDTIMYRYSGRPTKVTAADRYQLISAWRRWLRLAVS